MEEIWQDIPEWDDYQVSNLGRVRRKPKLLKEQTIKGRKFVSLRRGGKNRLFAVSQVVAMGFLDHTPCGFDLVVDHIDNNPLNNNVDNLQVITNAENVTKDKIGQSSKFMGVQWHEKGKKWRASCCFKGKRYYIGLFNCEFAAHCAYAMKLKQLKKYEG
jgi:hypothetical protein